MLKLLRIFLIVAITGPVLADDARRISVSGTGVVAAAPDMATVSLGVIVVEETAQAALRGNSQQMAAVLDLLTQTGVAPRDVQTSQLSLQPRWDRQQSSNAAPDIIGYQASNQVAVRVRDLDALGSVLDALTQAGANRINGVTFGLQNPRPLQDEARRLAVTDARSKAMLYTEAAGVSLGDVMTLSESGGMTPRPMAMSRMSDAESVPIAEGELEIRASVSVVFAIE